MAGTTNMGYGGAHGHGLRRYGAPDRGDTTDSPAGHAEATSGALWSAEAVLRLLLTPGSYFAELRRDAGFAAAGSYCVTQVVALALVVVGAAFVGEAVGRGAAVQLDDALRATATAGVTVLVCALVALGVTVAAALALHPVAALSRGSGGFGATYASVAYGSTPVCLLYGLGQALAALSPAGAAGETGATLAAWLGIAGLMWSGCVTAIGLRETHRLHGVGGAVMTGAVFVGLAAVALGAPSIAARGRLALQTGLTTGVRRDAGPVPGTKVGAAAGARSDTLSHRGGAVPRPDDRARGARSNEGPRRARR
jgi:hypothetical protein